MADRYDPKSGENLDKFDNAGDPSTDTWATLVTHITGYPVPDRNTVFDTLRSDHGGKLFRMDIKERSLSLAVKDSGFLTNTGEDYDIYFFDGGKKTKIMQARIVFEGRVKAGEEIIFAGPGSDNVNDAQVREGNEFTDYNKDKMSTVALARYMNGPRTALMALLGGGTQDARFSNMSVGGSDAVDLNSFNTTGESFDFAAKFFKDHAVVLKDWEDRFGRDDASWKGEAAEVFRSLLTKIRENYDSYVETFNSTPSAGEGTGAGSTVYSRALSQGRKYLEDSASKLLDAWLAWAKSPYYDPHQVLRYTLDDLAQWADANNVAKTNITSTTSRYSTTVRHNPQAGFSQVHPEYGDLTDIANWAKVGDAAVKVWNQGVNEYLGKPAAEVQSNLNNHFLDLSSDFSDNVPKPKSTDTASDEYEKKKLEEEKEEIKKENEENKKYQDELRAEQERQREEDKKYQDELREEQNKQREEDKKYQDELREEQNKQREEDKKYQDELREEQKKEQEEAKKLQEDLRLEQNQQRDEDKQYQDELREEQKKEQEEAKREAEEQAKAMEESLGGLNDPNNPNNPLNEQNLDGLDELLNQNNQDPNQNPVTESLGDIGDVNNQGGGGPLPVTSQNLGNFGGLNGGSGASLRTPTGGNTQAGDGKLTTDFPDGSSTSFDPDSGLLTTTSPNGTVTTQDLGNGLEVTNPDGSVTSLGDDGKLTTTFPDGTTQTVDPATGQAITTNPDGSTTTTDLGSLDGLNNGAGDGVLDSPTGGSTQLTSGGDLTTDFPDGSSTSFDPDTGALTTTAPDGSVTTQDLGNGLEVTNPDGSVTSLGDDGKLTTTFPDGTSQTVDPSTGQAVTTNPDGTTTTENLGNLGDLNSGGIDGVLDTPTGGSTQLTSGGDLTTDFPDGSSTSFDPDTGALTTTAPDGSVTTQDLGNGLEVTNPDGSVTSLGDDGKLTTTFPDGTSQTVDPSTGQTVTTNPDGTTTTENLGNLGDLNGQNDFGSDLNTQSLTDLGDLGDLNSGQGLDTPTGGSTGIDDAGDFATTFRDGSTGTFDPDTGTFTSTDADGTTTTTDLTHGAEVTNPDGSTTRLDNGLLTTDFPDGSTQVIDPETGIATVTDAQGNTETVNLNDLNRPGDLDRSDLLDSLDNNGTVSQSVPLSELGLGGGSNSAFSGGGLSESLDPLSPGAPGSSDVFSGTGVAPLSDSAAVGTSFAPAASSGTPGAPGTPGSPGMPMGGGMGGAGGGGDKGNGERVRTVLVDAAEESERRNRRRRSAWHRQEDSDTFLSPASRVTTTGGGASSEEETPAEAGRRSTSSADYLEEDGDVWGTEEGGTPAVIGR
ncbi:AAWKG family protein [Streptomyces sp. CWNU-52B]|uniref:AAWKG family protein n=1 Tax=unclassified Streptomyces TaxID=2593676 RepID=UPI0039C0A4EA